MFILQLISFILAVIGFTVSCIKLLSFLRAHFNCVSIFRNFVQEQLQFLQKVQKHYEDTEYGLRQYHTILLHNQNNTLTSQLFKIYQQLCTAHKSLVNMEKASGNAFQRFRFATRWMRKCTAIREDLEMIQECLLDIDSRYNRRAPLPMDQNNIRLPFANYAVRISPDVVLVNILLWDPSGWHSVKKAPKSGEDRRFDPQQSPFLCLVQQGFPWF